MFARHVSSLTSAYCHDELSREQSRRVAEYLISCRRCRAEFEEIKFGAALAAQLPLIEAPDSLWGGIKIALDRDGKTALTRQRRQAVPFLIRPRLALASLVLAGLVIGFAAYWLRYSPRAVKPVAT